MATTLAVFSTKPYDRRYLEEAHAANEASSAISITFHDVPLNRETVSLATGVQAVCAFVNDTLDSVVIDSLARQGVRAILLRCAGFNHVDLEAAARRGIMVSNVPSYSPEAVAEFAVALMQTLNRSTHRAYNRVREANFSLNGLLGMTLHGKTAGLIGTGKIGLATARIMRGFGCHVLAYDPFPTAALTDIDGCSYVDDLDDLLARSDIVSLHCPLMESTRHVIDERSIRRMRRGVLIVNTSRGGLIKTDDLIQGLKDRHIGGAALDVYEGEADLFYEDHSGDIVSDDVIMRLTTFHNVIVTGHQAFFTAEALREIADCTLGSLVEFVRTGTCAKSLTAGVGEGKRSSHPPLPVRNV
ncbi:D-lactate dehydrogenase [Geosmithia morbida]|uniref:D-lactate dehydrogenase n=1 Tax=Geosmithia morbida TaxID=1094350 RepID=A0A9P4Z1G3_9HYPO|nr:D-lactate dehydrogenase [Geosmithia morbida]KAF4126951.1 D-lactate dehydrogenase [Geosmithia morbida]